MMHMSNICVALNQWICGGGAGAGEKGREGAGGRVEGGVGGIQVPASDR